MRCCAPNCHRKPMPNWHRMISRRIHVFIANHSLSHRTAEALPYDATVPSVHPYAGWRYDEADETRAPRRAARGCTHRALAVAESPVKLQRSGAHRGVSDAVIPSESDLLGDGPLEPIWTASRAVRLNALRHAGSSVCWRRDFRESPFARVLES